MNEDIISSSELMKQVCDISLNSKMSLPSVWKSVVLKIKSSQHENENSEKRIPIAERLAGNTRVVDLKNGVLLVETDHPGWVQYLKIYQKFILTGLKMQLPDLEITSLAFRVAGSKAELSMTYAQSLKKAQEEMNSNIEKQEEILNNSFASKDSKNEKKNELPKELLEKLESIKRSMLTNSDK